jgi:hypothetical protein
MNSHIVGFVHDFDLGKGKLLHDLVQSDDLGLVGWDPLLVHCLSLEEFQKFLLH